jgi:hypothetical protein
MAGQCARAGERDHPQRRHRPGRCEFSPPICRWKFVSPRQPTQVQSPAVAAGDKLDLALDTAYALLAASDEPILARLQREMAARALNAEGGDETRRPSDSG